MTQPTCAACLQPITGRASFVIAGTEVVHKKCVGQETIGWRTKRRLAEVDSRIATLEREVPEARDEVRRVRDEARRIVTEMRGIERAKEVETQRADANRREALVQAEVNATLRRQLDQALQDLQAAILRGPETPPQREEGLDDSALRFSLLELDGA